MRRCRGLRAACATGAACRRGRWCVFSGSLGGWGCVQKGGEAHLPRAGSAGGVAGCCRGRWCVLTIGGIEPPLLWYECIPLTSVPVQASCPVYRACDTNIHGRGHMVRYSTYNVDVIMPLPPAVQRRACQNTSSLSHPAEPEIPGHTSCCTAPPPSMHVCVAISLYAVPQSGEQPVVYKTPSIQLSLWPVRHVEQWHAPYTHLYASLSLPLPCRSRKE